MLLCVVVCCYVLLLSGYIILKELLLLDGLTLAILSSIFVGKCVFCFTSNENCHLSSEKTISTQNGLLIFLGKETHSETQSWKSSRILRVKPNCFIFSLLFFIFFIFFIFLFLHFLSFSFIFFHVLSFSFIVFHFMSCSVMFFHCLSLSFIVFHFLSFSVFVGCSKSDFFWASISLRFLFTILM